MSNDAASSSAGASAKPSRKPKYSKFTQQELPACKPLLTPGWVIAILMLVGAIFIPIGAIALLASNSVVEIVEQYETSCLPANITTKEARIRYIQDDTTEKSCPMTLTVPKKMNNPVYVYYQLDHYYQNHRRYVKSRSDKQLLDGASTSNSDLDSCKPLKQFNNTPIIPCGLIAWSLFNDTYLFSRQNSAPIPVNKRGISWKSDRDHKFGSTVFPSNFPNNLNRNESSSAFIGGAALNVSQPLSEAEDLIVWMRSAALPTFRKLWGKIETDLQAGEIISVNITNVYNTYEFGGKKKLVLSTASWLGGKNNFLGIAYLTVGVLCIFLAIVFFLIHYKTPRPLGDTSYLSWNRKGNVNGLS
ncbi:hypothetical protein SELMODRAFT_270312 [Selaginella moellendorffii]|uniref:ALA-interacting subunit n=1 Tax=Selaginella moellendorffii TaxID=88036 RepID=D8QUQ2_SELML|nr:ALA-interacting subunit 1 [Selaginella moellendorffii]EFJ36331.1 hypothetical protein SELMODRAFT_270312 [Selaginella moellendorffii]|eukprot:XP_002962868.1 ALA-interacting subunit 1 [Selaginella moellendorffii]